ncbi:MAG TPA: type II secretion system F family protein [Microthrixaceae bacterium]|nr:type II secretion system F family protein [Microthrixaceae bacterium]HMT22944.1 type II secretion system F family protein [Microthrixaceae bacterium]HMT60132.1 type II secretion system F family protein [Microthrixaceae bacterium]
MTATMSKYRYEAETPDGREVKGTIEATSANVARNQLAVNGMRVTKIVERKGLQVEITKTKVPLVDLMHFSRQMGTFMRAGVPVLDAIENLRQDTKNQRFVAIMTDILERVSAGATVADAIAQHADVFPPYYMAMLRSSEYTGRMDEAFEVLYYYLKRDVSLSRQVRKALIYPMILMVVAIGVSALIVIFVIPKFAAFFEGFGAELPLPTRMLIAIADFVGSPLGAITGVVLVAGVVGLIAYVNTEDGRYQLHAFMLKVPNLSTVIQFSATERFCRVLGALLDSGVSLSEALPSAIECTNHKVFQRRLTEATEGVLAGQGFAEPLRQVGLFPSTMLQMVKVGERTGELSDQLTNTAAFYEDELEYAVDKLTQWFEPLVLLFIGVVVGFVALAMVSAMYGIYGQLET